MDRLSDRYDVIVVGARCAGAATAMLLARAGLDVLVVDHAVRGSDTLSTHALMRAGVAQLTRWGLLSAVQEAGTPAVTTTVFDYGTHATTVTIRAAAGVSALYAPRRHVLDRILVDAAEAAGAEVRFGVSVRDVLRDRAGRVCGVEGRDRRGRPVAATAPLVVGADGIWSTVAAAVGAPVVEQGRHAGAAWCTYVTGLPADGFRWFYRPGAAAGFMPTNDGATCVFTGMASDRFRVPGRAERWPALLETFAAAAPAAIDRLREATPVEPVRGWPGTPSLRRHAHGPGWALVGDAGYYKDPLGTHGITQALRDAELLADAILRAAGDPAALDTTLADYQRRRDVLSADLFAATDALASYAWDVDEVALLLRRLASAMSDEVDAITARPAATWTYPAERAQTG
ncbi:MAG: FAD-dependent oxidoreductase [Actinomycetes bacterium]